MSQKCSTSVDHYFVSLFSRRRYDILLVGLLCLFLLIGTWLPGAVKHSTIRITITAILLVLGFGYISNSRFRVWLQRNTYQRERNVESVDLFSSCLSRIRIACLQEIRHHSPETRFATAAGDDRRPDVLTNGWIVIGMIPIAIEHKDDIKLLGWAIAAFRDYEWHPTSILLFGSKADVLRALEEMFGVN